MESLIAFLGGAGFTAVISVIASTIESNIGHNQHQKDVTMSEVRLLKDTSNHYDKKISRNINNSDSLFNVKVQILLYISLWATNVQYHRINRSMASYGLSAILHHEYSILSDDIPVFLSVNEYRLPALKMLRLFRQCGIITFREEWLYAHRKRNEKSKSR